MRSKFLATVILIFFVAIGCSKSDNPTTPDDGTGDNTGNGGTTLTLSGNESHSFSNLTVTVFLDTNWLEINIADAAQTHGVMLTSDSTKAGTFTIPDQFTGVYSDADAHKMYEFYEGTVTITSVSSNSVNGTFTAKGYLFDINTLQADSTKILNVTGSFTK
jgi:hypothetical protein